MKKRLLLFLMTLMVSLGNSQVSPTLKAKNKLLGLSSLEIKVEIVGNRATTTYDMLYYNPSNQVLEGELSFPLGDGHNVSRFALDVNGKLREAVVVDKELGRIAFEQVVRRGVDPALLQKGTGNNYKARIYPIPANGYKRVLLAYEQDLIINTGEQFFDLPLYFKKELENFKLEIVVFDQKDKPVIEKGKISGLEFKDWERNYRTSVSKKGYTPNKSILIKIPIPLQSEKLITYNSFFYFHKVLSSQKKLRLKPKKITVFWDASLSMEDRDLNKELNLLESYFNYIGDVSVEYISFSNTIHKRKNFKVVNGNWKALRKELLSITYDGGTAYNIIGDLGGESDVKLLFSDGITSLSKTELNVDKPLFIINSLTKSNYSVLNHLAESSNGSYINMNTQSNSEAVKSLKFEPYKFLGFRSNSKTLQVFPKGPISVSSDFSLSGKNVKKGDKIFLEFGYNNEVIKTIPIVIKDIERQNKAAERIWAQKKLNDLQIDSRENKAKIIKLGVDYGLVTDYTSLIILEDVRDYITYKITPPNELLEEYNKMLVAIESRKAERHETLNLLMETQSSSRANDHIAEVDEMVIERPSNSQLNGFVSSDDIDLDARYEESNNMVLRYGVVAEQEIVEVEELEVSESHYEEAIAFSVIEISPTFPDCEGNNQEKKECFSNKMREHVSNNFDLQLANSLSLSGRIRINTMFTINSGGEVENIRVRSPHQRLERETRRVLELLPTMIPGKQRGRNISVNYSLPIMFIIGDDESDIDVQLSETVFNLKKYTGKLVVNERLVTTDYLDALKEVKNREEAYNLYLKQRKEYLKVPAYYIDVSNYFRQTFNDHIYSSRILSNIAETDFDDYELLKAFGYQLQSNGLDHLALFVFKRVLELRPEDTQSYRDLGLAYENVGKCQRALDLYNSIITGGIYENNHRRNFKGITQIAKNEIKYLIQNYKDDLDLSKVDKEFLNGIDFDIRIVVDWNHNDTDIDLHIIDPNLEECYYEHTKTRIGGRISPDMTQGFGPEEFVLNKAIKGNYFIKIKYYGDRYQKEENPTFMKVTMFKYYGSKKEIKETKIIRLTKRDDQEIIAKLSF
ncbi:VIT domain-containing protein [Tamlana sp. 2201CG12-4]|uniref:VIT domain-containing protein n=1 Tax=Tamlana sp. 2201CG12-4 TaxID=3112582 RepID=UPI002DBF6A1E|nr:VIT domain-containing protein [Tamlana sp. 2201CG12-4]MEC3906648.1 VIT domain-containing protein [Tamlana sp. 2201CG12-4]